MSILAYVEEGIQNMLPCEGDVEKYHHEVTCQSLHMLRKVYRIDYPVKVMWKNIIMNLSILAYVEESIQDRLPCEGDMEKYHHDLTCQSLHMWRKVYRIG